MNGTTFRQGASISSLKKTLKEFSALTAGLNSVTNIDTGHLDFQRDTFSGMGRGEARLRLWDKIIQACHADIYEDVYKLISLTHQSYDQFKRVIKSRYNTHRYITEQALTLINVDPGISQKLMEYCTFPDDRKSDMQDLIFEGHFYGKTHTGSEGNFLNNLFPATMVILAAIKKVNYGFDEDIQEHAVMNFWRNYKNVGKDAKRYLYLGVAAHYLQDLTAPHHVGNYPAVPYVDHYFFEKFASRYVHGKPHFQITKTGYDKFKGSLISSLSQPEAFAKEIYGKAIEFIPYIETDLHSESPGTDGYAKAVDNAVDTYNGYLVSGTNRQWEEAIDNAIPLAVYATAYLFEASLS